MQREPKVLKTRTGRWLAGEEDNLRNLGLLARIGQDAIIGLMKARAEGIREGAQSLEQLAKKENVSEDELANACALTTVLLGLGGDPEDVDPFDLAIRDLTQGGFIDNKESERLLAVFHAISVDASLAAVTKRNLRDGALVSSVFPRMHGLWTRCVMLQEMEPEYKLTDKPEQYSPARAREVPALCLQLDISVYGTVKRFSFGLLPGELDSFINRLRLAAKQLEISAKENPSK
jgi:hypothetical protein